MGAFAGSETERVRAAEAERRHRVLSEISAILLDYVGQDEVEPLRRIVHKVTVGLDDWCAFSLVEPDGILRQAVAYHPDPRQRDLADKLNRINPPRRWGEGPREINALLERKPVVFEEISDETLRAGTRSEEAFQLLENAVKYSPRGGQVVISVERNGGAARVSVSDQGIGVPAEEQAQLFRRFFRARNAARRHFGGLGIGLFVSNEIIQRHGGRFEVRSASGKGSTFSFLLSLAPAEPSHDHGKARILLVDDEPDISSSSPPTAK